MQFCACCRKCAASETGKVIKRLKIRRDGGIQKWKKNVVNIVKDINIER